MPLIPLAIPPGVYRNGTDLQAANRWRDANLVRWHEGALRPVGGWRRRDTIDVTGTPRGMLTWQDNGANRYIAVGTAAKLYSINSSNVVSDITPNSFTAGRLSAAANTGYGGGNYGDLTFGTERPDAGSLLDATTWALDTWGEYLVGTTPDDGRLYEWTLNSANKAALIANAPTSCRSLMVTEERFLFALGAGGNPRKIAWSGRENNTVWTPSTTNEAGDIELQTSGRIMAGVRTRGQALLLTDQDAHTASYVGPPYVYGFERAGTSCGLIATKAVEVIDAGVIWMGRRSFFIYSGGSVQEIPCDVGDYVFSDMNMSQISKIHAVKNSAWSEIWWFYPSGSSTECDRYVSYNYVTNVWMIGVLSRTSGVDRGIFRFPMWFDPDGVLYEHEFGYSHGGLVPYIESGPIFSGNGDSIISAVELIPDEKTQGDVQAKFKTRFYPNDVEREFGPYSMANPTPVRFTGRQLRMRVEGLRNVDWRVGLMRLDVRPGGTR
jgi:hypothetical protein